jgi:peptide/nickel transport system substrate-binding protein
MVTIAKFLLISLSDAMEISMNIKLPEKRRYSLLAVFLALVLAVVHGVAWAGPVEGHPRRGGTLILGMAADPSTLNCGIESSQIVAMVTSNIYNGLLHMDEASNPHPDLAQSWDISPDGLVYTFQLRENVKWHDGQPLTSADVKFSFENLVGKYNARGREAYRNIKAIETPNATTVKVSLKKVYSPFLEILTAHDGCIMPKHIYEGGDVFKNPRNNDQPIGSGPFKLRNGTKAATLRWCAMKIISRKAGRSWIA